MIRNFAITNFKSIGPEVSLDLAGLTVFAGPNSAGKSSLLQGLMVLAQSAGSPYSKQPVELRGYLVDLGTFRDVVHRGADQSIRLTCTIHFAPSTDAFAERPEANLEAHLSVEFSRDPKVWAGDSDVRLDRLDFECKAAHGAEASIHLRRRRGGPKPKGPSPTPVTGEILLTQRDYLMEVSGSQFDQLAPGPLRFDEPEARLPTAVQLRGAIPGLVLFPYDPIARQTGFVLRQILRLTPSSTVSDRVNVLLRNEEIGDYFMRYWQDPLVAEVAGEVPTNRAEAVNLARRLPLGKKARLRQAVTEYLSAVQGRDDASVAFDRFPPSPLLAEAATAIGAALSDIRHLGPLREAPRPFHRTPTSGDPRSVGTSGEYTAAVLHRFRSERIEFLVDGATERVSLQDAVNFWLARMGVHAGAQAIEYGRMGHFIGVEDPALARYLDLTQVGVGVSQLLPVLVQVLVAPPGSTVLLEQPELHLHPAVQSHIAEFLLAASAVGRQIVCETHSEYLVNRLRVFAAQGDDLAADTVRVYFVARVEGTTVVKPIVFGPNARVSEWPVGFFDQSVRDASDLLEAGLGKH